jgi:uncharacterized protein YcaQ
MIARMQVTLDALRRYAVARSLFKPTTLKRAIDKLGFVQADPIRAPARAQDLTLRHRVINYCAGDLERLYPRLAVEEDFFVNYGFLPRAHHELMHPRTPRERWSPKRARQAAAVLAFIRERGAVHPREVDAQFAHGKTTNWFGGSSNASTQLLDAMHYRGLLRVARRDGGTRVYRVREAPETHAKAAAARAMDAPVVHGSAVGAPAANASHHPPDAAAGMDALLDLAVRKYAPLPAPTLGRLVYHLRHAAPQWAAERPAALARAKQRLQHARVEGLEWYWPPGERPQSPRWRPDAGVRLLTPFDPIVWDRRRFEIFWGWAYRFEAYTPPAKRKLGYYALPLLWQAQVIGWGNLAVIDGTLRANFGYSAGAAPRDAAFRAGLEAELERLRVFLAVT